MDLATRTSIRRIVREAMRDAVNLSREDLSGGPLEEERQVIADWAVNEIARALNLSPSPTPENQQ